MSLMALARKVVPFPRTNSKRRNYEAALAVGPNSQNQSGTFILDFPIGIPFGFAIVATSDVQSSLGEAASNIVATEVFSELKFLLKDYEALEEVFEPKLQEVLSSAYGCARAYFSQIGQDRTPGISILVPVAFGEKLYWATVGRLELFLFRDGKLNSLNKQQLKTDADLDCSGKELISERAESSAFEKLPRIRSTENPTWMQRGDIMVSISSEATADQTLKIQSILAKNGSSSSEKIANALLNSLCATVDLAGEEPAVFVLKLPNR